MSDDYRAPYACSFCGEVRLLWWRITGSAMAHDGCAGAFERVPADEWLSSAAREGAE